MPAVGITGGIATGKSAFSRSLLGYLPADFFDADRCAKELLDSDAAVRESVRDAFGPGVFNHGKSGELLDRERLREIVFSDDAQRRCLEKILHPAIRERWAEQAAECVRTEGWFVADIPLLYETGAEAHFDHIIVVACSRSTQWSRLRESRGLDQEMGARIINAQLDLSLKMRKADYLIWNDSTAAILDEQASLLAAMLRQRHG